MRDFEKHRLLAVDSGHPLNYLAGFVGRELRHVGSGSVESDGEGATWAGFWPATLAVVEIPQADGRTAVVDDLIKVAVSGARYAQAFSEYGVVTEARPREWKGSLPKAICHLRMWAVLSDAEKALIGGEQTAKAIANACNRGAKARWKKHANHHYSNRDLPTMATPGAGPSCDVKITHDILDAVALGLWYLGRLNLAAVTKG